MLAFDVPQPDHPAHRAAGRLRDLSALAAAAATGDEETRAYYRVRARDRALVAAVYLGLIALLVLGMDATHVERTFDDV